MNTYGKTATDGATMLAMLLSSVSLVQAENVTTTSPVYRGADETIVGGDTASLLRMEHCVSVEIDSIEMKLGHVVTLWWVIMNNPAGCGMGSGIGGLAGMFRAHLAVGDVSNAMFGEGLHDPFASEIHIVLRDYGPAVAGMTDEMLYSYNGGCEADVFSNAPCDEFQFAMFPAAE